MIGDRNQGEACKVENLVQERGVKKVTHVSEFFIPYMIFKRKKCVYMWVAKGQITHRVYAICNGENNVCLRISSW
jgi:hypothetical protein